MNVVYPAQLFHLGNAFSGPPDLPTSKAGCQWQRLRMAQINTSSYLGRFPESDVGSPKEMTPKSLGASLCGGAQMSTSHTGLGAVSLFLAVSRFLGTEKDPSLEREV